MLVNLYWNFDYNTKFKVDVFYICFYFENITKFWPKTYNFWSRNKL